MKKFLTLILLLPLFVHAQYPDSAKKLTPNLHALSFNSLYATGASTSNNQVGYLDLTTGKWNGLATAYQLWLTNNAKQNTITLGTTSQYFRGDLSLATFPTGLPPTGTAGGDLNGTYPNPTINTINSITKSYYDPTSSIQNQLNRKVWVKKGTVLSADVTAELGNVYEPTVIQDSLPQIITATPKVFKMWYTGGWITTGIYYAESVDGLNWVKDTVAVVSNHARSFVLKNGSTYVMYAANSTASQIDMYTSANGHTGWTLAHAAVIVKGTSGTWNSNGINNMFVFIEGGIWKMLLEGGGSVLSAAGYYTSPDGITWTAYSGNPVIGNGGAGPFVKKIGNTYWLWGHGNLNSQILPTDIFRFSSPDMINWTISPNAIVLPRRARNEGGYTTNGQVADPVLVEVDSTVYIYYDENYNGGDNTGLSKIGLAIASMPFDELVKTNEGDGGDPGVANNVGNGGTGQTTLPDVQTWLQIPHYLNTIPFVISGNVNPGLANAQVIGALTTGLLKNTTTTGALSIAVGSDLPSGSNSYVQNTSTLQNAANFHTQGGAVDGTMTVTSLMKIGSTVSSPPAGISLYANNGASTSFAYDVTTGGNIRHTFYDGGVAKYFFGYNQTGSDTKFVLYDYFTGAPTTTWYQGKMYVGGGQTAGAPTLDVTGNIGSTTLAASSVIFTDANKVLTTTPVSGAISNAMLANGAVANLSGTNTGDNAANSSTMYIGTTAHALNRASASEALTGITSIDGSAATLTTSRTINGVSFNGSGNITVPAAAGTLTGATLASGVTASSLTSVGTLGTLTVSGLVTSNNVIWNQARIQIGGSTSTTGNGNQLYANGGGNTNFMYDVTSGGYHRQIFADGGVSKYYFGYNQSGSDTKFGFFDNYTNTWTMTAYQGNFSFANNVVVGGNLSAVLPAYSSGTNLPVIYNSTNSRFETATTALGTVTSVTSANSDISVATGTTTPVLTFDRTHFPYSTFISPTSGDYLFYNGSQWVNRALTATAPLVFNATTGNFSISNFPIHGNSTTTGTATTAVTVTIGSTMANTTYATSIIPRDLLTAVNYYISAQTTTTFTVTFVTALTGSINFDWVVTP